MRLRSQRWISALGVTLVLGFALPAGAAGDAWVKVGAEDANVRSIAIDPSDQRRVYAAARNDGIWRSTDRGSNWVRSNQGLDFISAWGVSVDPSDPSKVWTVTEVGGAYRSSDHGKTWRHTHEGLTDSLADYEVRVSAVVNSNDTGGWSDKAPDKANRGGMWGYLVDQCVSEQEQGSTPNKCAENAVWPPGGYHFKDPDIDADTAGDQPAANAYPKSIFHFQFGSDVAAIPGGAWITGFRGSNNSIGGGAFLTKDGGATWDMRIRKADGSRLIPPAGDSDESTNIWRIRVSPTDPNRIHMASTAGVWSSVDAGKSWRGDGPVPAGEISENIVSSSLALFFGSGGPEVRGLAIDHTDPNIVYAGTWGSGVMKSVDGGSTWVSSSKGMPNESGVWDIAVSPINPKNLFAAVFWHGIYQSSDGGSSWTPLSQGLDEDTRHQVYSLAIDKGGSPQNLYAGTINGIWRLSSEGFGKGSLAATGPDLRGWSTVVGLLMILAGLLSFGRTRAGEENRTPA